MGYSVKQVLETARKVTGKEIPTRVGPRRAGDPAVLIASSDKIKRELGWKPAISGLACDHRIRLALDAGAPARLQRIILITAGARRYQTQTSLSCERERAHETLKWLSP